MKHTGLGLAFLQSVPVTYSGRDSNCLQINQHFISWSLLNFHSDKTGVVYFQTRKLFMFNSLLDQFFLSKLAYSIVQDRDFEVKLF